MIVRNRQILLTVAIEVPNGDLHWIFPCLVKSGRAKSAIAVSGKNVDAGGRRDCPRGCVPQ